MPSVDVPAGVGKVRRRRCTRVVPAVATTSGYWRFQVATCLQCGKSFTNVSDADAHSVACGPMLPRTGLNVQRTGWV
jgi:hypothetical protein